MQGSIHRGTLSVAIVIALIAIAASAYLTYHHFLTLKMGVTGESICNINSYFNCDLVLGSRFSTFATFPVAGIALLFYIYLLVILVCTLWTADIQQTLAIPYLLAILSVVVSMCFAFVSFVILQSLCVFCLLLYILSFLILIWLQALGRFTWRQWVDSMKKISWVRTLSPIVVIFTLGAILLHTTHNQYAKEIPLKTQEKYLEGFFTQPIHAIDTNGRPYWGNPKALIEIVEFSDFECPYCGVAAFNLKPLLVDYRDKVKLIFMNYPLDQSCNAQMPKPLHQHACETAYAAYCAGKQGKFWEYHDHAFKRQKKLHKASLENIAQKLKLDIATFQACIADDATKDFILSDLQEGRKVHVEGTPTIFLGGRLIKPWGSRAILHKILDRILAEGQ